eukprot:GDKI01039435.1.p2 GENE.GDKI01039435.1~~GDKI01039435.1.p2  ORF type:complete len:110 (+),score=16.40 GDKI01039435.1:98-427(+)
MVSWMCTSADTYVYISPLTSGGIHAERKGKKGNKHDAYTRESMPVAAGHTHIQCIACVHTLNVRYVLHASGVNMNSQLDKHAVRGPLALLCGLHGQDTRACVHTHTQDR